MFIINHVSVHRATVPLVKGLARPERQVHYRRLNYSYSTVHMLAFISNLIATLSSKLPKRLIPICTCNISLHHETILPERPQSSSVSRSTYPQHNQLKASSTQDIVDLPSTTQRATASPDLERKSKNIIVEAATATDKTNSLRAVDLVVLASVLIEVDLHLTDEHSEYIHDSEENDDLGGCVEEEDQAGVFGHGGFESD